jgi:ribosomal protein L37AE/L43A
MVARLVEVPASAAPAPEPMRCPSCRRPLQAKVGRFGRAIYCCDQGHSHELNRLAVSPADSLRRAQIIA